MLAKAYLSLTMLRRVLTCLAIVTGLAAVGAPVNATIIESLSEQVRTSKPAPHASETESCECRAERERVPGKRGETPECKPRKSVVIHIPAVLLGSDRALE